MARLWSVEWRARRAPTRWSRFAILCVGLAVLGGYPQPSSAGPLNPGSISRQADQAEVLKIHCCHAHPLPPYDRYCCHSSGAYYAPRAYVGPTYAGSVRRQSRRVSRRTSRRVSRRR
jgi:hypothetical protein